MQEVINKTVEGLRAVNQTMAQQQSIICGLLVYWEKVQSDMEAAVREKAEAEKQVAAPAAAPAPTPADNKWVRESFVGKDLVEQAKQIEPLPPVTRERLEAMDPNTRVDFIAAAQQLTKATAAFSDLYKTGHGRVEPVAEPVAEAAGQPTEYIAEDTMAVQAASVAASIVATVNQFLSPEISQGGRGFIQPKPGTPARQFQDDILRTPSKTLAGWPTGFYRNADTRSQQLLISSNGLIIQFDKISASSQMELVDVIDSSTGNSVFSNTVVSPSMKEVVINSIRWALNQLHDAAK